MKESKHLWSYEFLEKFRGESEIPGKNHNRIIQFLQEVAVEKLGLYHRLDDTDEVPHSSLTVIASVVIMHPHLIPVLKRYKINGMAKSWLNLAAPREYMPSIGDILIFHRGNDPRFGHVGWNEGEYELQNIFNVYNANQSNMFRTSAYNIGKLAGVVDMRALVKMR